MLSQTVFDQWAKDIQAAFANADPIMVWAWILLISGIAAFFFFIFFTEFKRAERESIKFSVITTVIASICIGLGLHFFLTASGYW